MWVDVPLNKQNKLSIVTWYNHHHSVPTAQILLSLSRRPSLTAITLVKSSCRHPVSAKSEWICFAGWPSYYIIEIGPNTKKSQGDLRRLVITQTPVRNHQLTLIWKNTLKRERMIAKKYYSQQLVIILVK